jgi:hypothetical protein
MAIIPSKRIKYLLERGFEIIFNYVIFAVVEGKSTEYSS